MEDDIKTFYVTLGKVTDASPEYFKPAMEMSMLDMLGELKPYPPQPARNRAKTFNTYVRGVGRLPKSAFFTSTGKERKNIKTKGAKLTSQRLGTKWTFDVEIESNTVTGTLSNNATYSNIVQGDRQPAFHAQTGWVTYEQAYDNTEQQILKNFDDAMDKLLEDLAQ